MTTQRKPKTVTIPQAEYSALLGVVAAHRADAGQAPSKVLEHYDSVTRKHSPEMDHGGRVYYVEAGKVYVGVKPDRSLPGSTCRQCPYIRRTCKNAMRACLTTENGYRGSLILQEVQAVG